MNKYSVLIVDDEDGVRHALRRALREEGYNLLFATGPKQAFDHLAESPVDIVISDHKMPRMSGLEFLTRVAENYPDTQRIMLTGQAGMETVVAAVNEGEIFRFLLKPWDDDEVRIAIRLAIGQLEMIRENARLLRLVEAQARKLAELERQHPGIFDVERDETGAVILEGESA